MRTFNIVATVIVLVASAAFVSTASAQSPYTKDARWSVEFGGKAYDRPGDDLGIPLIIDGITRETLFDSEQASSLGSTAGAEVKFNFVSRHGNEIEIRTILANWNENYEIEGDNLRSPFFPVPGSEPTTVNYDYESDYFSIELMKRKAILPGVTCMFGPRFVSTKDEVTFAGSLLVDPGDGSPPVVFTQTQTTEATNALIGLQGGFEVNVPVGQTCYVNGFMRLGGYTNPTEVTIGGGDNFSNISTLTSETKSTGSFLGEVGGRLYGDIVPNCLAGYVGYEATWIDGIALAPAQLLPTSVGGVETSNTAFFHAVTFGFNFSY